MNSQQSEREYLYRAVGRFDGARGEYTVVSSQFYGISFAEEQRDAWAPDALETWVERLPTDQWERMP